MVEKKMQWLFAEIVGPRLQAGAESTQRLHSAREVRHHTLLTGFGQLPERALRDSEKSVTYSQMRRGLLDFSVGTFLPRTRICPDCRISHFICIGC